ncbi:MAG: universal stress protein [Cellvibrionaceae bacterium]
MIQTIVFATDLCVFTPHVVQHVITLAKRLSAGIVVVHAVEPLGSLGKAMVKTYLPEEKTREFNQQGMSVLLSTIKDRVVDMLADEFIDNNLGLGQVSEVIVEAGRPVDVILKHAKRSQADLIVMGSRGPGPGDGFGLGSVTSKVLQLSKIPVYTVPVLSPGLVKTRVSGKGSDHSSG